MAWGVNRIVRRFYTMLRDEYGKRRTKIYWYWTCIGRYLFKSNAKYIHSKCIFFLLLTLLLLRTKWVISCQKNIVLKCNRKLCSLVLGTSLVYISYMNKKSLSFKHFINESNFIKLLSKRVPDNYFAQLFSSVVSYHDQ